MAKVEKVTLGKEVGKLDRRGEKGKDVRDDM